VLAADKLSLPLFILCAWFLGGTITHALSLANHELAHNLGFHTTMFNEMLGMVANCAQGMPSCITFKKYHLEHHYYQGLEGTDTDIPSELEGKLVTTIPRKLVWVLLQPFCYAFRPMLECPKPMRPMEWINLAVTVMFDLWFAYKFGLKAVVYNLLSLVLGMGLHPVAGHFIAEHYQFFKDQETYSYYGILNMLCFNVGYHNEHHDFPKIAGFNLPKVREIAPEFYQDLYNHKSWVKVIYDYITRTDIGPYSRIKRSAKSKSN